MRLYVTQRNEIYGRFCGAIVQTANSFFKWLFRENYLIKGGFIKWLCIPFKWHLLFIIECRMGAKTRVKLRKMSKRLFSFFVCFCHDMKIGNDSPVFLRSLHSFCDIFLISKTRKVWWTHHLKGGETPSQIFTAQSEKRKFSEPRKTARWNIFFPLLSLSLRWLMSWLLASLFLKHEKYLATNFLVRKKMNSC